MDVTLYTTLGQCYPCVLAPVWLELRLKNTMQLVLVLKLPQQLHRLLGEFRKSIHSNTMTDNRPLRISIKPFSILSLLQLFSLILTTDSNLPTLFLINNSWIYRSLVEHRARKPLLSLMSSYCSRLGTKHNFRHKKITPHHPLLSSSLRVFVSASIFSLIFARGGRLLAGIRLI